MVEWEGAQQEPARRVAGEPVQLVADVGARAPVQEAGIGQLLDPRVDEGDAQERAQRQQREPREARLLRHGPDPTRAGETVLKASLRISS